MVQGRAMVRGVGADAGRGGTLVLRQRASAAPGKRSSGVLDAGHAARLAAGAANVERVLLLASHLPEPERALLEAIYRDGVPVLAIARLRGTTSRAVRRRAALLVARVSSPVYAAAVSQAAAWPEVRAGVARRCVIAGVGVREAAREMGVSVYTVRCEMARVRAIAEAMVLGAGAGGWGRPALGVRKTG